MESRTSPPAQRFRLDRDGYQLLCGNSPVRLEKQPMELLILLAERSGQLVTRDEIAAISTALSVSSGKLCRTTRIIPSSSKRLSGRATDSSDLLN